MDKDEQLKTALTRFMGAFELIFHEDWDYTQAQIANHADRHVAGGTFLYPGPESKIVNWGAIDCLYGAHRELQAAMRRNALYPNVPEPDPWFVYDWPDATGE